MEWTDELAVAVPKVVLHEHLDGGLRPQTLIELAAQCGYDGLPSTDPAVLGKRLTAGASRRNLELYLEGFTHTVAVLQTADALHRAAREAVEDLADDGVHYAEIRFAPELNTAAGLALDDVLEATLAGLADGPIPARLVVDGMRTSDPGVVRASAEAAVRWRDRGVVGFDLAGAEAFHPAGLHAEAIELATRAGLGLTLHAGEAAGPQSVAEAVYRFGAPRIGHGVTLVEDVSDDGELGPIAARVRELGVVLEMCPTSNVHTGAVASLPEHPIERLRRLGFAVTINTDNRLMSDVTMSSELRSVGETFDWTLVEALEVARTAARAAFCDPDTRTEVLDGIERAADGVLGPRAGAAAERSGA